MGGERRKKRVGGRKEGRGKKERRKEARVREREREKERNCQHRQVSDFCFWALAHFWGGKERERGMRGVSFYFFFLGSISGRKWTRGKLTVFVLSDPVCVCVCVFLFLCRVLVVVALSRLQRKRRFTQWSRPAGSSALCTSL